MLLSKAGSQSSQGSTAQGLRRDMCYSWSILQPKNTWECKAQIFTVTHNGTGSVLLHKYSQVMEQGCAQSGALPGELVGSDYLEGLAGCFLSQAAWM